ncbi:hypothetical protein BV25DRAFT_555750 [Artomyces pyxidatus]|uniref:Uncharacterized protein n=1 Tax=Artomyces pyxidatus TaxID=48021 RepID=A0ACB8TIS0_9AGAM|nr:hypothetical protein BV25DRAFT_555750 [Artomyces pyxidatus]
MAQLRSVSPPHQTTCLAPHFESGAAVLGHPETPAAVAPPVLRSRPSVDLATAPTRSQCESRTHRLTTGQCTVQMQCKIHVRQARGGLCTPVPIRYETFGVIFPVPNEFAAMPWRLLFKSSPMPAEKEVAIFGNDLLMSFMKASISSASSTSPEPFRSMYPTRAASVRAMPAEEAE